MPGKQVKNWKVYHALRREGKSKESAARIANSQSRKKKRRSNGKTTKSHRETRKHEARENET